MNQYALLLDVPAGALLWRMEEDVRCSKALGEKEKSTSELDRFVCAASTSTAVTVTP